MTHEQKAEAKKMWCCGLTAGQVALHFGVNRNLIVGIKTRGDWPDHGEAKPPAATTVFTRCDALNAKMDAVLAATKGVGHVPNEPRR